MFAGLKPRLQGGAVVPRARSPSSARKARSPSRWPEIQARQPTVEIGSYPFMRQGSFGTSLVLRSVDEAAIADAAEAILAEARTRGVEVLDLF